MSTAVFALAKKEDKYEDVDFETLLEQLSPEEIEELSLELIDPDDSHIPPADRCRYKMDKAPTGPFDRKKLLEFLEKKAREEKDWEDAKPYVKEIRGKIFKPKEEAKAQVNDDASVETEWDEALAAATEEELVDLAAILGFHGMLNQVQYHQAFVENADMKDTAGGFSVHARPEELKTFGDEDSVNSTNVEESLQRVKDNDPKLKELNLNNIKTISIDTLKEFAEALKTNTSLEILSLCNTRASDKVAKAFAEALRSNKTLKSLSLESNYISGTGILNLIEATNENQTLIELHVANQRPQLLGVQREAKIAELLKENKTIVKLGIFLESRNVQVKVHEILERNYDEVRKDRMAVSNGTKED